MKTEQEIYKLLLDATPVGADKLDILNALSRLSAVILDLLIDEQFEVCVACRRYYWSDEEHDHQEAAG